MTMNHHDSGLYVAHLRAIDTSALPPDGGERFNRLIFSRSPYLLQHAENPVAWREWGDEAFEAAREAGLPLLVSVGYATCHWCHVMARESFEDQEVAGLLNRHFVCIKVDREERPDIDDFCMAVAQAMTGSGGWPLNVFMTPDREPFFAMTYLPKRGRDGMHGLMELLANIAVLWRQRPDRIEANCAGVREALSRISTAPAAAPPPERAELEKSALQQLSQTYDRQYGGFGRAPKFPMPLNLVWLLRHRDPSAHDMALTTLLAMRSGGIWDHLGGGLHRYSTDRQWLAPHFEKMLYDQAMVSLAALDAFCRTGDSRFREIVENIMGFVHAGLTAPEGGFYSALDADSEGREGACYLWGTSDVRRLLGTDADLFCRYFDVSDGGNFEGENILHTPTPFDDFCRSAGLDEDGFRQTLERCRATLAAERAKRIQPLRDEKIVTSWNGLMIAALARCGIALDRPEYLDRAAAAARFVLTRLRRSDGRLLRSFMGSPGETPAFLEDYAALILGVVELHAATLDGDYLDQALELAGDMLRLFRDPGDGSLAKIGRDAEQMPSPASFDHDGVTPSPFSLAASCLARLARSAGRPDLADHAREALSAPLHDARRHAASQLGALMALEMIDSEPLTVTFHGAWSTADAHQFLNRLAQLLPPFVVTVADRADSHRSVSVCANGVCHPPPGTLETFSNLLGRCSP